jgi:hypothetical protein
MSSNVPTPPPDPGHGEFLLYQSEDGRVRLSVRIQDRTVWLPQRLIAELFQISVPTVNEHLATIYDEREVDPAATIRKFRIVQSEGSRQVERLVDHYSLDTILAVGYRVRSQRGTQFRQWATANLRELLVKGFVLDDERLKAGKSLGQDYFDELLARIRDIRASERRFYQKITHESASRTMSAGVMGLLLPAASSSRASATVAATRCRPRSASRRLMTAANSA